MIEKQPAPTTLAEAVAILTPTHTAVFTGLHPIEISGLARDFESVESLTVTANGDPIYTWSGSETELTWTTTWTPPAPGTYSLEVIAEDMFAMPISDPAETVIHVGLDPGDVTPPDMGTVTLDCPHSGHQSDHHPAHV